MTFDKLGPLLEETRTPAVCEKCSNYIYKRIYYDENSEKKRKVVFVCKNCLENSSE
ncbi:MAG: hypothetical protein BAJALOKI1v1_170015 [Promethearchaeota archaeon]|nr:MAG: hypothetical protein BAJALOKI1v1_170015 [Candidatus Lokiarchaeota archaeon]